MQLNRNVSHKWRPSKGFFFGALLIFAQINLSYGLVLVLSYLPLLKIRRIPKEYLPIVTITAIQLIWIWGVNLHYESKSIFYMLQLSASGIILTAMVFVSMSVSFIDKMLRSVYLLFLIDFCFNLSIYVFGVDPFGRSAGVRPGDLVPRVGGIFGHPFYSVNIATVALISGVFLNKKNMIYLAILGLIINGTFRSPLMLALTALVFVSLKFRLKLCNINILSIIFVSCVFGATFMTAVVNDGFVSGNYLRVAAWLNAIQNIAQNPIFGAHIFTKGSFDEMSLDTIIEYGIAESSYLQLALDFGILAAVLNMVVLYLIMRINVAKFYKNNGDRCGIATAAFSIIAFADSFYGTLYGSVFTAFVYAALCLSFDRAKKSLQL